MDARPLRGRRRAAVDGVIVVLALVASVAAGPGLADAAAPGTGHVPVAAQRLRTDAVPVGTTPESVAVTGLPAGGVRAVWLTVTARSGAPDAVTLWSGTGPTPDAPTVRTTSGITTTTTALVPLAADGRLAAVAERGPVGVTVDVTGWVPSGPAVDVLDPPALLFDSARDGRLAAGTVRPLPVGRARAGDAVLLSVDPVRADTASGLTLWPGGAAQPVVPSVPVSPGAPRTGLALTAVGRDGRVDLALAEGRADVVVRLLAVAAVGTGLRPVTPVRLVDTRPGTVTADGRDAATGAFAPGTPRRVVVAGRGGVPPGATAVVAHLGATVAPDAGAPAVLRVWPGGAAPSPPGPAVVARPGESQGGLVVVPLGSDGSLAVQADGAGADVALDVHGWTGAP